MTEQEYIDVSDLARIRAAQSILREVTPGCSSHISEAESQNVHLQLQEWEKRINEGLTVTHGEEPRPARDLHGCKEDPEPSAEDDILAAREATARRPEETSEQGPRALINFSFICPGSEGFGHAIHRSEDGLTLSCLLVGCPYYGRRFKAPAVTLEEVE